MNEAEQMYQEVERISAFVGAIVHHFDGEVRISYEEIEAGLPANSGLHVEFDDETEEIVFTIKEIPVAK